MPRILPTLAIAGEARSLAFEWVTRSSARPTSLCGAAPLRKHAPCLAGKQHLGNTANASRTGPHPESKTPKGLVTRAQRPL